MSGVIVNPYISFPAVGGGSHTFVDADAEAFSTAIGTLNTTQQAAVDQLALDLKADSLWAKMTTAYPFVGGTDTAHSYNLVNPATFQITWNGGVTHDANGITGDGFSGYGDTGYNPSVSMTLNDNHFSVYTRTATSAGQMEMGGETGAGTRIYLGSRFFGNAYFLNGNSVCEISVAEAVGRGLTLGSRRSSTDLELYRNGSSVGTDTDSNAGASAANTNIFVGGGNNSGLVLASAKNIAFASIGTGMTDTDASNLYTVIQAYQTALSRNV